MGGWNAQCAEAIDLALKEEVKKLSPPFSVLVILESDAMATPDALEINHQTTSWLLAAGMSREAFVCPTCVQRDFIEKMLLRQFSDEYSVRCFSEKSAATEWLVS